MSPRDDVLAAAGNVVAVHQRTWEKVPTLLREAIKQLEQAVEVMNSQPRARSKDPKTSRQGPQSERMTSNRHEVLLLLRQRPRTDEELVACLSGQMSASGARTRRAELVRCGLVKDSGERRQNTSGRKVTVWAAT